jgi:alpha-ketoglutarate-dependent taurine dioxygenase
MALDSVELKPRVGSEIRIDKAELLSGRASSEIRKLLEQRGVVIFRAVDFSDDDLRSFGTSLGELQVGGYEDGAQDSLIKVTFDKAQQRAGTAGYFRGTFHWHMDELHRDVPPLASILSPRVLSPAGGQTEFANTYAAYADLPESEKKALDKLTVYHSVESAYRKMIPDATEDQIASWRSKGHKIHPLIWTHRTGRKSIVNGITAGHILGMDRTDSDALLKQLLDWATQPQFVYQHQWRMGDLLMWDNTGTMHRVLAYDMDCGRRLHRVTLIGEEPLAVAA